MSNFWKQRNIDLEDMAQDPLYDFFLDKQDEEYCINMEDFLELLWHPYVDHYVKELNLYRTLCKKPSILVELMDKEVGAIFNIKFYGVYLKVVKSKERK